MIGSLIDSAVSSQYPVFRPRQCLIFGRCLAGGDWRKVFINKCFLLRESDNWISWFDWAAFGGKLLRRSHKVKRSRVWVPRSVGFLFISIFSGVLKARPFLKWNWTDFLLKTWNSYVQCADKIRHISAKHGGSIVASPPDVMGSNLTDNESSPNKEFLRWNKFSWKRLMWKRFKNRTAPNVLQRSPMMILFYFASVKRKSRHRNDATMKSLRSTKKFKRPLI